MSSGKKQRRSSTRSSGRKKPTKDSAPSPSSPSSALTTLPMECQSSESPTTEHDPLRGLTEFAPVPYTAPTRDDKGRFVAGQSGNPAGRPPNTKNELTRIKQDLELAVRRNISPEQIAQVVHRLYELAIMGSVGAAKLLLDKTISNAKDSEEETNANPKVSIVIENLTLPKSEEREVIDVTPPHHEE